MPGNPKTTDWYDFLLKICHRSANLAGGLRGRFRLGVHHAYDRSCQLR
ncbi:MAG: hypothetical protein ACJ8FY_28015 [Gemmataceae bacterium]